MTEEQVEKRSEDTKLWRTIQRRKELDRLEEETKRWELEERERTDPFRKLDATTRTWLQRYLSCSGIIRDEYGFIVGTYKRLTPRQIRGIMDSVHGMKLSTKIIQKFKEHLVEKKELLTDQEYEQKKPTKQEMAEIRKERKEERSRRKEERKSHLAKEDLAQFLEHKRISHRD